MSPFFHSFQKYISGLKGLRREPTHSTAARRLLAFCTPPQKQGAFDEFLDIESNLSGGALRYGELAEWENPPHERNPPSGLRGFLKKVAIWFSDRRAHASHGRSDSHYFKKLAESR